MGSNETEKNRFRPALGGTELQNHTIQFYPHQMTDGIFNADFNKNTSKN